MLFSNNEINEVEIPESCSSPKSGKCGDKRQMPLPLVIWMRQAMPPAFASHFLDFIALEVRKT